MRRTARLPALVAALLLVAAAGRVVAAENEEEAQAEALAELRRVRLEQALVRAERTAVMLGDLLVLSDDEGSP